MRSRISKSVYALPLVALMSAGILLHFAPQKALAEGEQGLNEVQKAEVRKMVEEYIGQNPDKIIESFKTYQEKQERQSIEDASKKIVEHKDYLTSADAPSAGNPKGDVTVVEFLDYNCGYCKKAVEDVKKLIETDKNVRVVFHEMPILGPTSAIASQYAHAAHKQGKYFEYHTALLEHHGQIDEAFLQDLGKKLGLDVEKMKKDIESDDVKSDISKSLDVAREVGIQGTPGFIVGEKLYPGYLGEDGLKAAVDEARKTAKTPAPQ